MNQVFREPVCTQNVVVSTFYESKVMYDLKMEKVFNVTSICSMDEKPIVFHPFQHVVLLLFVCIWGFKRSN
jgi:hypothetical protein